MKRVVICGVGNRLYGDEGIGPESLAEIRKEVSGENLIFLDCGRSPQDRTKEVLDFKPDLVVIISALDMKKGSGIVEQLEPDKAKGHLYKDGQVDVGMFVGYLDNALGGNVIFIGFQPRSTKKGYTLSPEARNALIIIRETVKDIIE